MSASFSVKHLPKTDSSLTRSPTFHKYYISYSGSITTLTDEAWLNVLTIIKIESDLDTSLVLVELEKYGEMVIKIGDKKSIQKEYEHSVRLQGQKDFVQYVFFRASKGILLMPYFPLGSIALYSWNAMNIVELQSCLKQTFLSILVLFHTTNMIHGDLHPGNVLLKPTTQLDVLYSIPEVGDFTVKTNGMRILIMDYTEMDYADSTTISTLNNFYYDIQKFFLLLYNTIKILDPRTIMPVTTFLANCLLRGSYLTKKDIDTILRMTDEIQCRLV